MKVIEDIKWWFVEKGLVKRENVYKQYVKFQEEAGELASDIFKDKCPKDSIGDVVVTLIGISLDLGVDFEECIEIAYKEISGRKGELVNGKFIKESDL